MRLFPGSWNRWLRANRLDRGTGRGCNPHRGDWPIELARYDIDRKHGFVAATDPPDALPSAFASWDKAARDLPAALLSSRARAMLAALPVLDPARLPDKPARERAFLILSVLASAYVWGGAKAARSIPPGVAVPLMELARSLDRKPIVTHASVALNNWRRLDPEAPLAPDNADCQVMFLGGADERWFFLATLGVELAGAPALSVIAALPGHLRAGRDTCLVEGLSLLRQHLGAMRVALARMDEWCAPGVFYTRVRPWLAGWPEPGIVYEGVSAEPLRLTGGSAAQSTLIQAFDAALGLRHGEESTGPFLAAMRDYMPAPHRAFLAALDAGPDLRAHVLARRTEMPALARAHDAALTELAELRREHMAMAARFITAQSRQDSGLGTGGTEFLPFLREARAETLAHRLGANASFAKQNAGPNRETS